MSKTKIVICGSLKQFDEMNMLSSCLESEGYEVAAPDYKLDAPTAYLRHISAIKNSDIVIVVPKRESGRERTHNYIHPNKDVNIEEDTHIKVFADIVNYHISRFHYDIGEATLYELCTALSYKKPVIITRVLMIGGSFFKWCDSVVGFVNDKAKEWLDGREED